MSLSASQPTGIGVLDKPVTAEEKAAFVRGMFDDIAHRYDLLNAVLSVGIHKHWRGFATRCACLEAGDSALDVCTGTGDWTVDLRRAVGPRGTVVGIDFSASMLRHGAKKFAAAMAATAQADATRLPFQSNTFDAATVGFGIRNVAEVERGVCEMARVVKPGGRVVILEFAEPNPGPFKSLYTLYSRFIMPRIGGAVSGRADAYTYLPKSVTKFKTRAELTAIMQDAGLAEVRTVDLMFGLVCVHVGVKA